ncbi:aldose 1-epimerase family protein [Clostridium paraputrificum]|uniref:aldose 1-epimerase family protein n=1 Tax=Clostridium TaxID=1485 RepID=UPI003D328CE0
MIYSLENSTVKITASNHGGEIHSLTSKITGTEYLWNGNPEFWKYHAPILFPIVGKVKDLKYRVDGIEYELPQHGLARISDFNLLSQSEDSITFELKYSEDTLKVYPYKFSLQITYSLEENAVKVTYTVNNLDDKEIFFSIGAHPAFMCPIEENEKLEDYSFKFNSKETSSIMLLNKQGYFTGERLDYLNNSDTIPLSKEVFNNDALVFDDLKSNKITIQSKNHSKSLSLDFTGFPYMGLWAPAAGAPFVCIEPWFGHADYDNFTGELKEKEGIISLDENKSFGCSYTISIS